MDRRFNARQLLESPPGDAAATLAELADLDDTMLCGTFVELCQAAHEGPRTWAQLDALLSAYTVLPWRRTTPRGVATAARIALARRCAWAQYDFLGGRFNPEDHLQDMRNSFEALGDHLCADLVTHDITRGLLALANAAVSCREIVRLSHRVRTLDEPARLIAHQLLADRTALHAGQVLDAAAHLAAASPAPRHGQVTVPCATAARTPSPLQPR